MASLDDPEPDEGARRDARPPLRHPLPVTTARKRLAEEWVFVLVAEGHAARLARVEAGWSVELPVDDHDGALRTLSEWRLEQTERAARAEARTHPDPGPASRFDLAVGYAIALAPLVLHVALESSGRHAELVARGESRAILVGEGELWRTLTALTLHADLRHAAGNTLIGGFFLASLASRVGAGLAVLAFLVTGSLGNLANAAYYGEAHSSIGASTGVFGLVGVLAGLAAHRRHRTERTRRGAWVAVAAALGLVAMLGGPGPKVDFSAHLFGLGVGLLAGAAIAYPISRHPRPGASLQLLAALASLLLVAGSWRLA